MPEFLELLPPPEAIKRWMAHLPPPGQKPKRAYLSVPGQVTAAAIASPEALPAFPRSTWMALRDRPGYLRASDSLPAYLSLAGEVPMGRQPDFTLHPTQAALIYTGGMLPEGADA